MSSPSVSVATPAAQPKHDGPPDGFSVPDFSAPLDVDACLALVPAKATVKGQVIQTLIDAVKAAGRRPVCTESFGAFRDYPMRDYLALAAASARAVHPDVSLREALRRMGQLSFPAFVETVLGRIMYGVFGSNVGAIFRLANKSYEMLQSTGKIATQAVSPNAVLLKFTNTYTFLDCNHVGVIEGALQACKVQGTVHARFESPSAGAFFVRWSPRS